jgi:phosphoenolpyruvate-protein phosphotransferase (PTS system enzyme I)
MTRLTGRGVAPGVAIGRAVVALRDASQVRYRLAASGVDRERHRLRAARLRTRSELEEISVRLTRTVGDAQAAIFAAQLLMLDDPLLTRRADDLIRTERINAEWALDRTVAELREGLASDDDAWVRDRIADVADVGGRLQRNLGRAKDLLATLVQDLEPPLILVTDELPPSVAAQLDWTRISGLVTDVGGPTNHTMILMRSLNVPAVVGLAGATELVSPEQTIAIDGATGEVVIDPSVELLHEWRRKAARVAAGVRNLDDLRDRPAMTADGVRIQLLANLEIAEEVARVRESGAEGIGLYRSEFLLDPLRHDAGSEAAQVETYRSLLAALNPMPVTIRTFDAGADGQDTTSGSIGRRDRFGFRGIRSLMQHDERFVVQIRALLRAADAGRLRILLPFVTVAEELRLARRTIEEIRLSLGGPPVPVGAMIEVPAAALTVDILASEVEFLSVGTNDLIQYTLAVDRSDEGLAGHYEPASPAVLRLLQRVAIGARRAAREIYVCGEMAADPLLVSLLVGLGFRAFSVTPAAIALVKRSLAAIDSREVREMTRHALRARSADEVRELLEPVAAAIRQAGRNQTREHA